MTEHLIVGNIFALGAAICTVISIVKKDKTELIGWQIAGISFCLLSSIALFAYAALATNCVALIRNILAYKHKLTTKTTFGLSVLCIMIGMYVNNLGFIGWLAIIASTSYTVLMYTTRNDQQMRYAILSNLTLWLIHDCYIQSYPTALTEISLIAWTTFKNKHRFVKKAGR